MLLVDYVVTHCRGPREYEELNRRHNWRPLALRLCFADINDVDEAEDGDDERNVDDDSADSAVRRTLMNCRKMVGQRMMVSSRKVTVTMTWTLTHVYTV